MTTWSSCATTGATFTGCAGFEAPATVSVSSALTRSDATFYRDTSGFLFSDTFDNRGNGTPIESSSYSTTGGSWLLVSNAELRENSHTSSYCLVSALSDRTDVYMQATMQNGSADAFAGMASRVTAGKGYFARAGGTPDGGVNWRTALQDETFSDLTYGDNGTSPVGTQPRFNYATVGTKLRVWKNGTLMATLSGVTERSGKMGFHALVGATIPSSTDYDALTITKTSFISTLLPSGMKLRASGLTTTSAGTTSATSVDLGGLSMPIAGSTDVLDSSNSLLFSYSASSIWPGDVMIYDEAPTSAFVATVDVTSVTVVSSATALFGAVSATSYDYGDGYSTATTFSYQTPGSIFTIKQRVVDAYGLQATSQLTIQTAYYSDCDAPSSVAYADCSASTATLTSCSAPSSVTYSGCSDAT